MQFDERDTPATTPTASPSPSQASHHRHGLDTRQPCTKAEPGAREAQAEPEPAPSSPQAVNAQQRPAGARGEPAARGRKAKPAPSRGGEDARLAGSASPTQPREPGTPAPMQSQPQPNTRVSPTACTQGADDLERERGGEGRRERERTENHSIRAPPTTCTR